MYSCSSSLSSGSSSSMIQLDLQVSTTRLYLMNNNGMLMVFVHLQENWNNKLPSQPALRSWHVPREGNDSMCRKAKSRGKWRRVGESGGEWGKQAFLLFLTIIIQNNYMIEISLLSTIYRCEVSNWKRAHTKKKQNKKVLFILCNMIKKQLFFFFGNVL